MVLNKLELSTKQVLLTFRLAFKMLCLEFTLHGSVFGLAFIRLMSFYQISYTVQNFQLSIKTNYEHYFLYEYQNIFENI